MLSVLGFLIILGPLVVVHEFGHYWFARIFGVKAEIFSIGFGPKLWSRQMGETELRVSAIPLGGYVKLLGEDRDAPLPPEEAKRALHRAAAWKRFFIFFGGPLFNFIWAILVFMAIMLIGEPQFASVVGRVVRGSEAEKAGFMSGDRITSVNGKEVRRFDEVIFAVNESPKKAMDFQVVHPGSDQPVSLKVTPSAEEGYNQYGEHTEVGKIDGFMATPRSTQIGVSSRDSAAGKAGLKTGDQILEMNGSKVETWEDLDSRYAKLAAGAPITFVVKTKGESITAQMTKPANSVSMGQDLGLYSSELFVEKVVDKSPAQAAGIQAGDRLVSVGGQSVESFFDLKDEVQRSGEKLGKVNLAWERDGKIQSAEIVPTSTVVKDPTLKKTIQFTVGVMPMLVMVEPPMVIERTLNPFALVYKGTERMVSFSWRNLVSIGKMITGDVSVGSLGGPILIGKIAGESLSHGLIAFLSTMAILSIGLGVLNILPVPVLDGGHLVLLAIESIRGKPLTIRQMEIIQGVGLILILGLMGVVMKNDLARLSIF